LKTIISEDLINANEIKDPNDDEIPSPSQSLTDPIDLTSDEENDVDYVISTSAKSTLVTKLRNKHAGRKNNLDKKLSTSTTKPIFIPKSHDNDVNNNDNLDEKSSLSQDSSMLLSTKSISKKKYVFSS